MAATSRLPRGFAVAVDIVLLTLRQGVLSALLIKRGLPPHKGRWALPGGFVLPGEDLQPAAARELMEEAGIPRFDGHLEQLATYGAPRRDPRGRVVSVAYLAVMPDLPHPLAGTDASDARWWAVDDAEGVAFDHGQILSDGVERARAKLEYTTLATEFVEEPFTLADLRRVYIAVWGDTPDLPNFRRKVLATEGFVEPVGDQVSGGRGRPAALYRRGKATVLYPPILRPST
jgi:8-oxo-dGTP diphosphatase